MNRMDYVRITLLISHTPFIMRLGFYLLIYNIITFSFVFLCFVFFYFVFCNNNNTVVELHNKLTSIPAVRTKLINTRTKMFN